MHALASRDCTLGTEEVPQLHLERCLVIPSRLLYPPRPMFSKYRRLPASLLVQPRLPHSRLLRYALEWSGMALTHTTPLAKSISAVLLDIDALSSPSASSDIVTTEPLEYASPLTERALRYQRRDALRAAQDVVALTSPHGTVSSNAILQKHCSRQIS